MKGIAVVILVAGVVGGVFFLRQRGLNLANLRLPGKLPQIAINSSSSGEVLGSQSPLTITHFSERFSGIGKALANIAGTLGVQTVKTGETLVQNLTATPSSSAQIIDMSQVVKDISSRVESIPGSLANQAKIEYCRQVLENATASATKK